MDLAKVYGMLKYDTTNQIFVKHEHNGQTWLVATGPDAGDYIFRLNAKSDLHETTFKMVDGTEITAKGYWHETAEMLKMSTEIDLTDKRAYWLGIWSSDKTKLLGVKMTTVEYGDYTKLLNEVGENYGDMEFTGQVIHRTGSIQRLFKPTKTA